MVKGLLLLLPAIEMNDRGEERRGSPAHPSSRLTLKMEKGGRGNKQGGEQKFQFSGSMEEAAKFLLTSLNAGPSGRLIKKIKKTGKKKEEEERAKMAAPTPSEGERKLC